MWKGLESKFITCLLLIKLFCYLLLFSLSNSFFLFFASRYCWNWSWTTQFRTFKPVNNWIILLPSTNHTPRLMDILPSGWVNSVVSTSTHLRSCNVNFLESPQALLDIAKSFHFEKEAPVSQFLFCEGLVIKFNASGQYIRCTRFDFDSLEYF